MYLISFVTFKQNCAHYERDYDFNKDVCNYGHEHTETFAVWPETGDKALYHPCKAKYCPILRGCKEVKNA